MVKKDEAVEVKPAQLKLTEGGGKTASKPKESFAERQARFNKLNHELVDQPGARVVNISTNIAGAAVNMARQTQRVFSIFDRRRGLIPRKEEDMFTEKFKDILKEWDDALREISDVLDIKYLQSKLIVAISDGKGDDNAA